MKAIEILTQYWDSDTETFNPSFVEAFVDPKGALVMKEFIRYFGVSSSYSEINNALVELTGSKKISQERGEFEPYAFIFFTKSYKFGEKQHVRDWIMELGEQGYFVRKEDVFNYVSRQRPEKSTQSFLPTAMHGSIHERKEQSSSKPSDSLL